MQNFQLTEIVKNLIIINVLFFIGTLILLGNERGMLALDYPTMPGFRPYQLVTCFFMHANVAHIFMNMLGLAMFGPPAAPPPPFARNIVNLPSSLSV